MTEPQANSGDPPPLSTRIFGGDHKPEEALDTPSKVRCALARLAFLMADGAAPAKVSGGLSNIISMAGAQNRAEAELSLKEREIAAVEASARELARRNDLRESELRILNAQHVGGVAQPAREARPTSFEETLRRLAEEGAEVPR